MSRVFDGTDDNCNALIGSMPTAVPVTLSAWVKMDASWATGTHTIVKLGDFSNYKDFFRIHAFKNSSGTTRFEASSHHGSEKKAQHGSSIANAQWYHVCGVFTSTTSRQVYVDGVAGTANTVTSEPDAADFSHLSIGASQTSGSNANFLYGKIAEVAVWNVALSTAEIDRLKNGSCALFVKEENLAGYWPIQGLYSASGSTYSEVDFIGGSDLSPQGATIDQSDNPVIHFPGLPVVKRITGAPPAASSALLNVIQSYFNVNR
tara:strand:+ start:2070 stop:2855 length:786 start_codon:yes stop_codon:yes gene_type:complete